MKVFVVLLSLVAVAACNSTETKLDKEKYESTKESLAEREKKSPLSFLSIDGNKKRNLLGQTVIKAEVQNNASVCAYKDVRIKMLFYKDGTLVANHEQILDDVVKANNSQNFKAKYGTPKGTDSVSLSIMSAVAVEN